MILQLAESISAVTQILPLAEKSPKKRVLVRKVNDLFLRSFFLVLPSSLSIKEDSCLICNKATRMGSQSKTNPTEIGTNMHSDSRCKKYFIVLSAL